MNDRYLDFVQTRGLILLVNDNHVNNNLKAILVHVYYSSIVNNRPKNNNKTTNKGLKRAKNNEHRNHRARTRPSRLKRVFLAQKHYVLPTLKISAITWENGSFLICAQRRLKLACLSSQSHPSLLSAWRNFASLAVQNAHGADSEQTARMLRLIWIFAGCSCPKVRFLKLLLMCSLDKS